MKVKQILLLMKICKEYFQCDGYNVRYVTEWATGMFHFTCNVQGKQKINFKINHI